MKQQILKFAPLLIAITALADTQFDLLLQIGLTDTAIAWVKLIGLLTALFLPSMRHTFSKDEIVEQVFDNSDPQNPKVPKTKF